MNVSVGTVLEDQFELLDLVGEGGMGRVFKARDRRTGRVVAVKTLLPQFASDPLAAEELQREVKLGQRLVHPRIVAVYEYRVWQRVPFIVMEFVDGRPLNYHQFEQPNRRLTEPVFLACADEILEAVGFAHEVGVVHRDLKPANMMVQPDGHLKLMDFGIAAALKATYTRLTGHTTGLTIQYASPEQINGENAAPSMDIYSLGCVFYEMLSGRPPFHQGEILHQHLTKPAAPIPGVSRRLNHAVLACLEKLPTKRPRSALEVRALLSDGRTIRITPGRKTAEPSPPSPSADTASQQPAAAGRSSTVGDTGRATDAPRATRFSVLPMLLIGGALVLAFIAIAVWSINGSRVAITSGPTRTDGPSVVPSPESSTPQPPKPARPEQVQEQIQQAIVRDIEVARQARDGGYYEQARAAYGRVLKLDPENSAAKTGLTQTNRAEAAEREKR